MNRAANRGDQLAMVENPNLGKRFAAASKPDLSILLYAGPPFFFGWQGMSVVAPIVWWAILAALALFSEYRPNPNYDELKSRPIGFGIALVAFVSIYFVARWLSPN